jgi:predicted GNAT family acetyltransferase
MSAPPHRFADRPNRPIGFTGTGPQRTGFEETMDPSKSSAVRDNVAARRFELDADGALAVASYRLDGDTIAFTHTEVPPRLQGRGIASRLVRGALENARARGLRVRPLCSFVADYIRRHPEFQDLVDPDSLRRYF